MKKQNSFWKKYHHFIPLLLLAAVCKPALGQQQETTFHSMGITRVVSDTAVAAKFPGGERAWQRYLYGKIKMTVAENHNAPPGQYTPAVSFVVEKDGTIGEVNALNNPGYGTAEELIRVIKKSPKWIPAIKDGVQVSYTQTQAITFTVSANGEGER